jgi:hypothetical protein
MLVAPVVVNMTREDHETRTPMSLPFFQHFPQSLLGRSCRMSPGKKFFG